MDSSVILLQGKVSSLAGKPWAAIEIVSEMGSFSERRTEEIVLHITRWIRKSLRGQAVELLFPVKSRDLDGVHLLSPYLLIRTGDLSRLRGISSVMGCEGVVTDGRGQILEVEDSFAEKLICDTRVRSREWSQGIKKGSYVRVIFGERRMLCGKVKSLTNGVAEVIVTLAARRLKVRIPVAALLNLGVDPVEYYYQGE